MLVVCLAVAIGPAAANKGERPRETKEVAAKREFLKKKSDKAGEQKTEPKLSEATKPLSTPPPATKPLPKLSLPLVRGQTSKGVTIPYNDGSGAKTMNFRIGAATPVDDDHIQMKDLTIETLDEAGEKEMTIDLPGSVFDLKTRVISGNERVTIKRSDFEITGASMEFNTETKQGRINGDVKMIIYDLSGQAEEPAAKQKGRGNE